MDVGVTQTDAIHYFDLFNYLFGELPHAVRAVVRHYLNLTLDDTSISVLEYGEKLTFVEAGYMPPETRRIYRSLGTREASIAISRRIPFLSSKTAMRGRGKGGWP